MHVFCICTCSAQISMYHKERRFRNTLIIVVIKCSLLRFPLREEEEDSNVSEHTSGKAFPSSWSYRGGSGGGGGGGGESNVNEHNSSIFFHFLNLSLRMDTARVSPPYVGISACGTPCRRT